MEFADPPPILSDKTSAFLCDRSNLYVGLFLRCSISSIVFNKPTFLLSSKLDRGIIIFISR